MRLSRKTRFAFTKSTQIFLLRLASGRSSLKKGIVWRLIPKLRDDLFVQFAPTQLFTIFIYRKRTQYM